MKTLLVFAYAYDSRSQVFAHKVEVIRGLSNQFSKIIVLAPQIGSYDFSDSTASPTNIDVLRLEFDGCGRLKKLIQIYKSVLEVLRTNQIDVVFFFMTEVFAAVVGPFLKMLGKRQVLWYAHAHRSYGLRIAFPFMDVVCSSTAGSIPIEHKKVELIGQMVDEDLFPFCCRNPDNRFRLVHIGRSDPSKNLIEIIQSAILASSEFSGLDLTLIGNPSGEEGQMYIKEINSKFADKINLGFLKLEPGIPRAKIGATLSCYGVFVHAFQGSLDKTLIEATLSGIPVASLNREYISQFGSWSNNGNDLHEEITAILKKNSHDLNLELERRHHVAAKNHSLEQWIPKITKLLNG